MYQDCQDDHTGTMRVCSYVVQRGEKYKLANHRLTSFICLARRFKNEREAELFCDEGDNVVEYTREVYT